MIFQRLVICSTIVTLASCVAPPAEFESAAKQGVVFQEALVKYVQVAKLASVTSRANSLAATIAPLSDGDRLDQFNDRLPSIEQGIAIYDLVRTHATTMKVYFRQLRELASTDADEKGRESIGETISSLNSLSSRIGSTGISSDMSTIVGEIVQAGISLEQRQMLADEILENGEFIEAQILLQISALALMSEIFKEDIENAVREQKNLISAELIDSDEVDGLGLSHRIRDFMLTKSADPGNAKVTGEKLLKSWRVLVRRAAGKASLEELYATLSDLSSEVKDMEVTSDVLAGIFGY